MTSRRRLLITVVGAAVGSAVFAYAVHRAGVSDILEGLRRVGWGILAILGLAGVRFLIRAECWRLCVPSATSLPRWHAFSAFLAGDAVGSVTPLGLLASEPTKVLFTRHHLATRESVASLALENLVYGASVLAMVGVGIVMLLATVPLPAATRGIAAAALAGLTVGAVVARRVLRGTWTDGRGVRPQWRERLAGVRVAVLAFSDDYRGRLWRVLALDLLFHALAVAEIYITLRWLLADGDVTLAEAVIFEALNRVVTVAFKFVPFRIGVDEALTGGLATMLSLDPAVGVALAVVRKIRNLSWAGVGLAIVAAHPARGGRGAVTASVRDPGVPPPVRPGSAPGHRP